MGTTKVSLLQKMRVKVDGKKVTLPYIKLGVLSVMRDGYRVILRTNGGEFISSLWTIVEWLKCNAWIWIASLLLSSSSSSSSQSSLSSSS